MTANNHGSEENKQRQHKEHNNTHCVVNAIVVFGDQKRPKIIEEFSNLLLHGSRRALALRKTYADQTRNILCSKWPDVYITCPDFYKISALFTINKTIFFLSCRLFYSVHFSIIE